MFATATHSITNRYLIDTGPALLSFGSRSRKGLMLHNEAGVLLVKLGSGVSLTNYTYRLTPNAVLDLQNWLGTLSLIRPEGSAYVMCTEII